MNLAFIGMGNMAYAILKGGCDRGFFNPAHVSAYDINTVRLAEVAAETGITAAVSAAEAARQADMVLLAVKPNVVESVVAEMGDALCGKAVLSIASGWTTEKLRALLPESARVMFVIPNTPCMVGEGMAIAEEGSTFTQEEQDYVRELFSAIGQYRVVPQKLMNGASTLTGCGPAFIYLIMEGLADGAVYHGVPRQLAYELAAQTVIGAGKMLLESGLHPGALKDNVCSPGGTTIRGIRAMEDAGVRAAMIDAIDAASHNA